MERLYRKRLGRLMTAARHRGFAIFGAILAVGILASFGSALTIQSATNHATTTAQIHTDQSYYSSHAAFEITKRNALVGSNDCTIPERQFKGASLVIGRNAGLISVTATEGKAQHSFSSTDPNPPAAGGACLVVDISNASYSSNQKKLLGVVLKKASNCCGGSPITVESIQISFTPDNGAKIKDIQIEAGQKEYLDPQEENGSGYVFNLDNTYTIPDLADHALDYIRSTTNIGDDSVFTLKFNLSGGSSKSVTIDLS